MDPRSGLRSQEPHGAGPCVLISELPFHHSSVPSSCSQPSSAIRNHQAPLDRPSVWLNLVGLPFRKAQVDLDHSPESPLSPRHPSCHSSYCQQVAELSSNSRLVPEGRGGQFTAKDSAAPLPPSPHFHPLPGWFGGRENGHYHANSQRCWEQ